MCSQQVVAVETASRSAQVTRLFALIRSGRITGNTEDSDSAASDGGEARIRYRGSDLTSNGPVTSSLGSGRQPDVISAQHDLGYRVRTGPQDRDLTERPSD